MASAPEPWQASAIPYSNDFNGFAGALSGWDSFGASSASSASSAFTRRRTPLWHWALALLAGLAQAASLALPGSGAPQWWLQLAALWALAWLVRPGTGSNASRIIAHSVRVGTVGTRKDGAAATEIS